MVTENATQRYASYEDGAIVSANDAFFVTYNFFFLSLHVFVESLCQGLSPPHNLDFLSYWYVKRPHCLSIFPPLKPSLGSLSYFRYTAPRWEETCGLCCTQQLCVPPVGAKWFRARRQEDPAFFYVCAYFYAAAVCVPFAASLASFVAPALKVPPQKTVGAVEALRDPRNGSILGDGRKWRDLRFPRSFPGHTLGN